MQLKPITGQEVQTCYPNIHSIDKLSSHALQTLHCIKEAAEAQNSRQADTAKLLWNQRRPTQKEQAEQAATTP